MRTTLEIDNDVLSAARDLARAEHRSVGAVISEMARRGFTNPPNGANDKASRVTRGADAWMIDRGFALLPPSGKIVTNEQVEQLREELGI
ncbi:MAG: hypothetical protein LBH68_07785 [Bifidobacteriaceae bacterium]|jgi:hypothetical protein|nr:hypothetical protein [Bifidobacteriaceae bacterium]